MAIFEDVSSPFAWKGAVVIVDVFIDVCGFEGGVFEFDFVVDVCGEIACGGPL